MSVNVLCHTPVNFSRRKRWVAHYTEGLVSTMPSLLLLIDCCIHNIRVNELNSGIVGKWIKLGFCTQKLCQRLCLSVCLSVYIPSRYENELSWLFFIFVDTVLEVNHLFSLIYVIRIDIHKSDTFYWIHYMNHLFSLERFQYLFKLLKLILSAIRLHNKDISLIKKSSDIWIFVSMSIFGLDIICDGI